MVLFCIIHTASASGDPHYMSFDKKCYDFMGEGKFVAFRIQDQTNIEFELQAEHKHWGTNRGVTMQTSILFGIPQTKAIYQVHNMYIQYKNDHLRNYTHAIIIAQYI